LLFQNNGNPRIADTYNRLKCKILELIVKVYSNDSW